MPSGTRPIFVALRLSHAFKAVSSEKRKPLTLQHRHNVVLCRKRSQELNKKVAKFKRGEPMHVKQVCPSLVNRAFLLLLQLAIPLLQCLRDHLSQYCSWLQIADKKLKGRMQHTERLNSEAAVAAAKTDEWLLPAEAGTLEAEGMERTWRFSQVSRSARLAKHTLRWQYKRLRCASLSFSMSSNCKASNTE